MEEWKGKIAVVIGAGSKVGTAIVKHLASHGIIVYGLARRLIELIEAEHAPKSGDIRPVYCDVSDINSIKLAFKEITRNHEKINILVNCFERCQTGGLFDRHLTNKDITGIINGSFIGAVMCTREAVKLMKHDVANIIYVNSSVAHEIPVSHPKSESNVYWATKHGLRETIDTMRREIENDESLKQIRISVRITELSMPNNGTSKIRQIVVSAEPQDVADAVQFIISSKTSVKVNVRKCMNKVSQSVNFHFI